MTADKVRANLSYACGLAGSAVNWAKQHNISAAYVCDVLNGRKDPGQKILDAMGLVLVKDYRRAP